MSGNRWSSERRAKPQLELSRVATEEDEVNMLAEGTAVELSKQEDPQGFGESADIAQRGGEVAHGARKLIEKELGRSVISSSKASDYISPSKEPELLESGDIIEV